MGEGSCCFLLFGLEGGNFLLSRVFFLQFGTRGGGYYFARHFNEVYEMADPSLSARLSCTSAQYRNKSAILRTRGRKQAERACRGIFAGPIAELWEFIH